MNDTFDTLLGLGILVGTFFVGKRVGHNISTQEYTRREYERDILLLRQEVAELKKQRLEDNSNLSS
jgi:hypothetical protein